jgi:hypothetical protein
VNDDPLRHYRDHEQLHAAFGSGGFGSIAEKVARFFGTPQYILGQSIAALTQKVHDLTEQIDKLTRSIHDHVVSG